MPDFDERDAVILAKRVALLDAREGPRVGDFVRFGDGHLRRISHIWQDEHGTVDGVQTSDSGSYHLGEGFVSMSGSLFGAVKPETLTLTEEIREGNVWFFHHDWYKAHNDVHARINFRVFTHEGDPTR